MSLSDHMCKKYSSVSCDSLSIFNFQKQSSRSVLEKKGVLANFAKFTGKHLHQSLFFNKVTGLRPQLY